MIVSVKEDELEWIRNNPERCPACGHLEIFHNNHCCVFCTVDKCPCEDRAMPEKPNTFIA